MKKKKIQKCLFLLGLDLRKGLGVSSCFCFCFCFFFQKKKFCVLVLAFFLSVRLIPSPIIHSFNNKRMTRSIFFSISLPFCVVVFHLSIYQFFFFSKTFFTHQNFFEFQKVLHIFTTYSPPPPLTTNHGSSS